MILLSTSNSPVFALLAKILAFLVKIGKNAHTLGDMHIILLLAANVESFNLPHSLIQHRN